MYACIDLGSNSFHLLIGEWDSGRVKIVERFSEKVQLGEGVGSSGVISTQAFQRGLSCIGRFKSHMDAYPLEQYWALGTNTFRVADNADKFIAAANSRGINISIISGVQEAVLIYAGVLTALPSSDSNRLVIDIGGGSTEIIIGHGHSRLLTDSLAIGSVAWRDRYFSDPAADSDFLQKQMSEGVNAACEIFATVASGVKNLKWTEAFASSGTSKMLALICESHGYGKKEISLAALHDLKRLIADSIASKSELPGLKESRRDLLLAGWCVLVGLMETYNIETINFSATALREGMLDFMAKNKKTLQAMEQSNFPEVHSARS